MDARVSHPARMRNLRWFAPALLMLSLAAGVADAQPPAPVEAAPVAAGETAPAAEAASARPSGLPTNIVEIVRSLGYWVVPFAVATLVAIWFTSERMIVLRRGRVIPKPFVQRFLKLLEEGELDQAEAQEICQENDSPIAHIFAHGVRKWGKPSVEVEQAIIDGGERQVSMLRKHLRVINGVATITPLIGLLGTVWGMLMSFNKIATAGAMGNSEQLAEGIALALVTTAAGLAIAIPSMIAYMYLAGRVDDLVMQMDDLAQNVVFNVSSEALADRSAGRTRRARPEPDATAKKKAV